MAIERVLLTGGAGFLGTAILRELSKPGEGVATPPKEIRVFDLKPVDVAGRANVVSTVGDIRDYPALLEACRDVDVVLHAASLVDWGEATTEELESTNVTGAENVVRACREAGVPGLVYTSTMDVVCGKQPVVDADESTPYPATFTNDYSRTKAAAEQLVLRAHGAQREARSGEDPADCRLATCAIRPCGIFGEHDPYHVANVLKVLREGSLPFRPGDGKAVFQHVYVGNVAHAHVLAMRAVLDPESPVGGETYFVTDDTPAIDFLEFMEKIVEPLGYQLPPRSRRMPYPVMLAVGAGMEAAAWLSRPFFRFTPTLTRSSVRFVCHTHSFVGDKARRDLRYAPIYGEEESIERTIEYFRSA